MGSKTSRDKNNESPRPHLVPGGELVPGTRAGIVSAERILGWVQGSKRQHWTILQWLEGHIFSAEAVLQHDVMGRDPVLKPCSTQQVAQSKEFSVHFRYRIP